MFYLTICEENDYYCEDSISVYDTYAFKTREDRNKAIDFIHQYSADKNDNYYIDNMLNALENVVPLESIDNFHAYIGGARW